MRILRMNLLTKLSFVLVITVALGFSVFTLVQTRRQVETLRSSQQRMASSLARGISAGLRHAMLSGTALSVEKLLEDARARIPDAEIHVYTGSGQRVFEPRLPPPKTDEIPDFVEQTLRSAEPRLLPDGTEVAPIRNEERCHMCHEEGELRGVLTLNTRGAALFSENGEEGGHAVAEVIRAAFAQLMTAGHEKGIDTLFEELPKTAPGVRSVSIYNVAGTVAYGATSPLPRSLRREMFAKAKPTHEKQGDSVFWTLPLENEPRCRNCHTSKPEVRGTLVLEFDASPTQRTLVGAARTSLDHVMLAGLGRLITSFLDEAASRGGITALSLYDPAGRLYHATQSSSSPAPPMVSRALSEHTALLGTLADPKKPLLSYVEPLFNDAACQRCHGSTRPLRGAIEVTLDTTRANAEQRNLFIRGASTALGTILLVLVALYLGLRRTVLDPVLEIGAVADRVSQGNLDHVAPVRTEDEIGRLAQRINDMITGLRKKLELSKFVSEETIRTVESVEGTIDRGGERKRITMLFSDIRGFTAFSEKHQPEDVVEMLNQHLTAQAEVVIRHGGDIDKYVGDELMARFSGDDMEARAIRCGVEMIEAVRDLAKKQGEGSALAVGIGINAGDVVIGAMGSTQRMDFTVIGDAVNVAARLCSAAKPGQVLVSVETAAKAGPLEGLCIDPLEPLSLKGKREPFGVVDVSREKP